MVPSLAKFFDDLTEITYVKDRVVEFFFAEAVNTVVWCGEVGLMCTVTILLQKKIVCDMTTRNWQFLINKHKETALPKSLFCDLEANIWAAKLFYEWAIDFSNRIYKKTQLLLCSFSIIWHGQVRALNFNVFPSLVNNVAKNGHNDSPSMADLFLQ